MMLAVKQSYQKYFKYDKIILCDFLPVFFIHEKSCGKKVGFRWYQLFIVIERLWPSNTSTNFIQWIRLFLKIAEKNPLVSTLSKEDKVQHLEFCKREPRKLCNFPPKLNFPWAENMKKWTFWVLDNKVRWCFMNSAIIPVLKVNVPEPELYQDILPLAPSFRRMRCMWISNAKLFKISLKTTSNFYLFSSHIEEDFHCKLSILRKMCKIFPTLIGIFKLKISA